MQTSEPCAWKLLMGARCLVGLSRFGKLNQNTLKTSFKMEMPPECTDKNIPKKKLTLGLWLLLMLKKKKNVHEKQRSLQGQLYCHAWKMQRMYFYTMLPKFHNCVSFFSSNKYCINTVHLCASFSMLPVREMVHGVLQRSESKIYSCQRHRSLETGHTQRIQTTITGWSRPADSSYCALLWPNISICSSPGPELLKPHCRTEWNVDLISSWTVCSISALILVIFTMCKHNIHNVLWFLHHVTQSHKYGFEPSYRNSRRVWTSGGK